MCCKFSIGCVEFNIDDHRTYLLGQSMGGAGALYLGTVPASTTGARSWQARGASRFLDRTQNHEIAPSRLA